jgi:hypothetical protein
VNCYFATEYVDIFFDQSCTPFAFVDPPLYGLNAAPLDGVPWNLRELEQPDELRYTQHFVDCFVFHMCWKTGDNGPTVALVLATRAAICQAGMCVNVILQQQQQQRTDGCTRECTKFRNAGMSFTATRFPTSSTVTKLRRCCLASTVEIKGGHEK